MNKKNIIFCPDFQSVRSLLLSCIRPIMVKSKITTIENNPILIVTNIPADINVNCAASNICTVLFVIVLVFCFL